MSQVFHVVVGESFTPDAGAYPADLKEFSGPHESDKTDNKYFKLVFVGDNDRQYIGFVDLPKDGIPKIGEKNSNKLGRFLAGLAGKPFKTAEAFSIDPQEYIGKRNLLVYAPNTKGNVTLASFTPITK